MSLTGILVSKRLFLHTPAKCTSILECFDVHIEGAAFIHTHTKVYKTWRDSLELKHIYIYIYIYTYTYTHVHTHTHIHIYAYRMCSESKPVNVPLSKFVVLQLDMSL